MKKIVALMIVLLMVASFLSACGPSEEGGAPSASASGAPSASSETDDRDYTGTTLNIISITWDFMDSWLNLYGAEVCDEMGIDYNVSWYTYEDARNKVVADAMAGVSTYDVIYIDCKQIPEFATCGALEPLEPMFEQYGFEDYDLDDFYDVALNEAYYDGVLYGVPLMTTANGLVYRTDIFEDAGEQEAFKAEYGYDLAVPETYEQYYDVAEFFTRKAGETLMGEVLTTDFYGTSHSDKPTDFLWHDYISYMYAYGAKIYDEETMMPLWNSEENLAAGTLFQSLAPLMPPNHVNMSSGESMAEFAAGRVAMIIEFYDRTLYLGGEGSPIDGKFAYTTLPTAEENYPHCTIVNSNFMGVSAYSQNKECAFDYIQNITSKEVALKWATHVPTEEFSTGNPTFPRASVMESAELAETMPGIAMLRETLESDGIYKFVHIRLPEYTAIIDAGATALSELFDGRSVEDAFNDAQDKMVNIFREAGYID